jgi:hypothetical protein
VSDIQQMKTSAFSSVTATGLRNLPASTVNSLPSNILTYATSAQLSSLINSPNYNSFDSSIKQNLARLSGSSAVITASTSNSNIIQFNSYALILCLMSLKLFL